MRSQQAPPAPITSHENTTDDTSPSQVNPGGPSQNTSRLPLGQNHATSNSLELINQNTTPNAMKGLFSTIKNKLWKPNARKAEKAQREAEKIQAAAYAATSKPTKVLPFFNESSFRYNHAVPAPGYRPPGTLQRRRRKLARRGVYKMQRHAG